MALSRVYAPPPAKHITVDQFLRLVRISRKTVYRYVEIGELPAISHGGRWVFHMNTVRAFMRRHPDRVRAGAQD